MPGFLRLEFYSCVQILTRFSNWKCEMVLFQKCIFLYELNCMSGIVKKTYCDHIVVITNSLIDTLITDLLY